jgi:hypothetical protein
VDLAPEATWTRRHEDPSKRKALPLCSSCPAGQARIGELRERRRTLS